MATLCALPTEVLYRILAHLDVRSQRHVLTANRFLYGKWQVQTKVTQEHCFLKWSLDWLEQRKQDFFDCCQTGITAYFIQQRYLGESGEILHPEFFEADGSFSESMAVVTHQGLAFPSFHVKVYPTESQGGLWKMLDTRQLVAGFGLVKFLFRPSRNPKSDLVANGNNSVFAAQGSKTQLLRRLTAAPPVHCAVMHLTTLKSLGHLHLLQATKQCYQLLCSRVWSRGQVILYLEPCHGCKSHIIIDLNSDGSWAVDDRKSRNTPVVLDFDNMPHSVIEVEAFYYSPAAMRFVDESEHNGCTCRAATDWDEHSKLFVYNQNIEAVPH